MPTEQTTKKIDVFFIKDTSIPLYKGFITKGLETLYNKTNDKLSFDSLLESCTFGSTILFIVFDVPAQLPIGFFCVSVCKEYSCIELDVSAAYSAYSAYSSLTYIGLQKVKEFGIIVKADRVTFSSPRKGSLKMSSKLGFKLDYTHNDNYYYSIRIKA